MKQNKFGWIVPALIVLVNLIVILIYWRSLPESLPAHFDLEGNAGGSMARSTLLFYPLAGAILFGIAYGVSLLAKKPIVVKGLIILATGIGLVIFSSTLVTLTKGAMPVFMLAEPIILLLSLAAFVYCLVKARK